MLKILSKQDISKPKAVIFDTDNTLYPYRPAHKHALDIVILKASKILKVDKNRFLEAYKHSRDEVKEQLGNTASSHSRLLYFQKTIENIGLGTKIFLSLDLEQTYWREFLSNARIFPGVFEFIKQLKNNNIKIVNITDLTTQIQFRKIVYFGLDKYFDYVVTSEEVGIDKPGIDSFSAALNKLKYNPQDIWMIGDNLYCDIKGANSVGMVSFLKTQRIKENLVDEKIKPCVMFDNYKELVTLVEKF